MLGQRSISLGLRDIENSRFNLAQLNGKTLMVATEQPLISISVLDIINRIISGERMLVEDKGKDPYEMIPKAKIIWAMTELPSVSSASDGIFRRVRVVEMPPIPKEYQDLSLKDQVMQEAPGILNWAIEGLSRLRQRGKFNIPESIHLASENYKHVNDLAKQFVNDCCEIGPEYKIQAQFLYNEYKNWCENNGHKPKSIIYMANEWKRLGFDRYDANGKRYWKGIKINVSRNIQHIEEKEINILIDRPSTSSTPSTVSSTIPGEWYIPETDKN
jgi:putative DNA primase/helicase